MPRDGLEFRACSEFGHLLPDTIQYCSNERIPNGNLRKLSSQNRPLLRTIVTVLRVIQEAHYGVLLNKVCSVLVESIKLIWVLYIKKKKSQKC